MASNRLREHNSSKVVILDTSSIMMIFEFKIDLEDQLKDLLGSYKIYIPNSVKDELIKHLKYGKEKKKKLAKPSLKYIEKYEILPSEGIADDDVIILALKYKGFIVTNDREIRKKAKNKSLKTIYLRSKKRLAIE